MAQPRRTATDFRLVCGFTAMYLLAAAVAAWVRGNAEFTFYLVVMIVLVAAVYAVDRRVRFSIGVLWGLSLWGAMHMAGGLLPVPTDWPIHGDNRVVYSWWVLPFTTAEGRVVYGLKYDHLTHAFGFGVLAWACWEGLCQTLCAAVPHGPQAGDPADCNDIQPTLGRLTLCFTAAMGFGAINEIIEFIATTLGPTNVGGYINTSYDLISNAVGALLAVAIIRRVYRD